MRTRCVDCIQNSLPGSIRSGARVFAVKIRRYFEKFPAVHCVSRLGHRSAVLVLGKLHTFEDGTSGIEHQQRELCCGDPDSLSSRLRADVGNVIPQKIANVGRFGHSLLLKETPVVRGHSLCSFEPPTRKGSIRLLFQHCIKTPFGSQVLLVREGA